MINNIRIKNVSIPCVFVYTLYSRLHVSANLFCARHPRALVSYEILS